jgi:hypothetical protein
MHRLIHDHVGEGRIVHVAGEYLWVLIHAVDELAFHSLIKHVLEVLPGVRDRGLLNVRIGHGSFPNLVQEKLVRRFELGSEPLIHFAETFNPHLLKWRRQGGAFARVDLSFGPCGCLSLGERVFHFMQEF